MIFKSVMPAQPGIQTVSVPRDESAWTPVCAGVTMKMKS
jgi:hypothetical protein